MVDAVPSEYPKVLQGQQVVDEQDVVCQAAAVKPPAFQNPGLQSPRLGPKHQARNKRLSLTSVSYT